MRASISVPFGIAVSSSMGWKRRWPGGGSGSSRGRARDALLAEHRLRGTAGPATTAIDRWAVAVAPRGSLTRTPTV